MKILKIDKSSVQIELTQEEVEAIENSIAGIIDEFALYPETNSLNFELQEEFQKIKNQMEN